MRYFILFLLSIFLYGCNGSNSDTQTQNNPNSDPTKRVEGVDSSIAPPPVPDLK
jgi:hypothetical protein